MVNSIAKMGTNEERNNETKNNVGLMNVSMALISAISTIFPCFYNKQAFLAVRLMNK